jgi:high-affinity Fe2+/Pb2+ permease
MKSLLFILGICSVITAYIFAFTSISLDITKTQSVICGINAFLFMYLAWYSFNQFNKQLNKDCNSQDCV